MDKKKLLGLVKEMNGLSETIEAPREQMREAIDRFKEEYHLHPAAFRLVWRLSRMPPEKLGDFLRGFDEYRLLMGLDDQGDLLDEKAA